MEPCVIPTAGEPPLAKISGIQFGLMTTEDIYQLSVDDRDNSVTKTKELADPKLGLPVAKGNCGTCNAETVDQCQGHFSHVDLPTPIFHPNHVTKVVTLLRKICLSCGQPKKKKAGKAFALLASGLKKQLEQKATLEPKVEDDVSTPTERPRRGRPPRKAVNVVNDDEEDYQSSLSAKRKKRKMDEVEKFFDTEARVDRTTGEESDKVILISSSDEEDHSSSSRKYGKRHVSDVEDDEEAPNTSAHGGRILRKRKNRLDSNVNGSVAQPIELADYPEVSDDGAPSKYGKRKRTDQVKDVQASEVTFEDMFPATIVQTNSKPARRQCKYCSGAHSEKYPEVILKVEVKEVKEGGKEKNLTKAINMTYKVNQKNIDSVASDYWSFVAGKTPRSQRSVEKSRFLLPSEALKILQKIPKSTFTSLGMHSKVAWPEALIMECIPVPPNCTRIQDDAYGNNLKFKQGIDRATTTFSKLLNRIAKMNSSRFAKPTFMAAAIEANECQSLFGLYLREKGAPKAVPGKEKKRIDHVGRVQKVDSRWSFEWLKANVLGKKGCYSARNVITGDPYLRVEEIGIPQQIAKHVTIPEQVNSLNREKLQECVNVGQSLVGRYRACGAVKLVRGTEKLVVTRKTSHELEIGDIVHRHLRDGDLVYVNRPPSLHKHSLLALRVHVQDLSVFTINPGVCAPLHADFDGDCLHVFVPQSEEAKAELHQLMTIPAQLLPSPDGKTIIGMSQDNIVATHLLTSTPVFLSKEDMFQMGMWSTRRLPIPAIVKSDRGPMWAGKQVIDLTIPLEFSVRSEGGSVDIQDGELLSYAGKENWLTSTNGLMRSLAQYSPSAAVEHLDCSQSALREWLLCRGFSVSLSDFYAAPDQRSRRKMIHDLQSGITSAESMAVNKELLFDEKYQKLDAIQSDMGSGGDPKQARALEDIAVGYFQQEFSEIGQILASNISIENQLLAMVRSGSKGSLSKVVEQIGSLGIQLYNEEHLLKLSADGKLVNLATSMCCEDTWEARGLVRSSLLGGLNPLEFYLHSIAVRAGLYRQSIEKSEPGQLFKSLMLFLRDIHVAYDGTVRNKCGLEIIQFSYQNPTTNNPEICKGNESVMPGEAVGILAATAIAQPAYQVMLEANHNVGSKKIRPLTLIQDTIFPRSGTKLKASDRKSILRLKSCSCNIAHCEEKRALNIQEELQPVSVEMVAKATSIQYVGVNSSEWNSLQSEGVKLKLPWVGHIQLDRKALIETNLQMERVVSVLEAAFHSKSYAKIMGSSFLGLPVFFSRSGCDCMDPEFGPCLHFSACLKSKRTKHLASRSNKKVCEFVDALRDVMIPLILKTVVKGDERIESAKLVWEDAAWSPCAVSDEGERVRANPNGELVVEVLVEEKLSTSRGAPWGIMKEACALIDSIDWRRSSPYGVQEIRHSLGVEAARDCILKRLTLATKAAGTSVNNTHLKLVSDLMVHSGDVNGITPFGYRDLMRSLKTSAPFTAGAFRAPIKTFMEAGEKGEEELFTGVLASSIFGKRVPIGTGADFTLQLQQKMASNKVEVPVESVDILECLGELNCKIKEEFPETPVATDGLRAQETDTYDNGGWGASGEDAAAWGVSTGGEALAKPSEAEGGWGEPSPVQANGGWGDSPPVQANGWDAEPSNGREGGLGAVNATGEDMEEDAGGWGAPEVDISKRTDGNVSNKISGDEGAWGDDPSPADDSNPWTSVPSQDVSIVNGHGRSTEARIEGASGWSPEIAANGGGWDAEEQTPAISGLTRQLPDADAGWDSEVLPKSNNPRTESSDRPPREFKPTGANTIPLGKIRQFGPKPVGTGSNSISPLPTPMSTDARVSGKINDGGIDGSSTAVGETLDSGWGEQEGSKWDIPEWDGKEGASDWGLASVPETAADGWESLDTQPTPVVQSNPPWSPRAVPWEKSGLHGQNGFGRAGGSSTPRTISALDNKADSDDWKEILDIVREVKDILSTYKPEERLKDEHHQVLLTQVLPHHPSSATKIGCGVDYFKVALYKSTKPSDRQTKCFYLVRIDGTQDDFSYHKCLQTMASKKNPPLHDLYAAAFFPKSNR